MSGFFATAPSQRKRSLRAASVCALPARALLARLVLACAVPALLAGPAHARTILVGPGRDAATPAEAAAMAANGDRVVFDPGTHRGCAIWWASRLTIEASGPGATVTGPLCADRAFFVFLGNDVTVRGLTFAHARALGHNGAGILMEGGNLTVENSRFLDNENGILAGGPAGSVVTVRRSLFQGNGSCEGACAHGLYVGKAIARLEVTHCVFLDTRVGHHIKSKAVLTIVRDNRIEDGPTGTSSYLIDLPYGGDADISDNVLAKGALSANREAAISIGAEPEHLRVVGALRVQGNRFVSHLPGPVHFVRNGMAVPARLSGNALSGRVIPLEGPGTVE